MKSRTFVGVSILAGLYCLASVGAKVSSPKKHALILPASAKPASGQPAPTMECAVRFGPRIPISALAFSPDGTLLAVSGYQEVLIWDVKNGKLAKRVGAGQINSFVRALVFGKDGHSIIAGEGLPKRSGIVRVFDISSGAQTLSFQEPKDVIYSVALSPDGKLLAAGGADAHVYVWNLAEKKLVKTIPDHSGWVLSVSFTADGKFLVTAGTDNLSLVTDVATWVTSKRMQQTEAVYGAAFNADGSQLALAIGGAKDHAIRIRRPSDTRQIRAISLGHVTPLGVLWTPKGNKIFVPCDDNSLKIYNGANGGLLANVTGHADWVYSVAVAPDETRFATGSADGTTRLWNAADHRLLATLIQLTPRTDEWLLMTPQGYLATSSPGALQWRATNVPAPDKLTSLFQNSESVQKTLAGEKVPPPTLP